MQKTYKSCGDLPIYNFYKILGTRELRYLLVGWDEYEELPIEENVLIEIWNEIYTEYCKLSEDNKSLMYYELMTEHSYFKSRFLIGTKLLQQLLIGGNEKERVQLYIEELKKWKIIVSNGQNLVKQINTALKNLKLSQNKIARLESEIENLKIDDEESISFMKQVVQLERSSGRNEIDVHKTTVEKWVAIIKDTIEVNEAKAKAHGRK